MFVRQLPYFFSWKENDISNLSLEDCRSHVSNVTQQNDCINKSFENVTKRQVKQTYFCSYKHKFRFLSTQVKGNIDVLIVSETKNDNSYPVDNFLTDGFSQPISQIEPPTVVASCCTLEKIFLLTGLPRRAINKSHIDSFYVELHLRNEKWLVNCWYNPNKTMICKHLYALGTYLDLHGWL